jgi:hypothetical protein
MKTQLIVTIATASTTVALLGFSSQAQAASFGTSGIEFSKNTEVAFTFDTSHASAIESLYIFNENNLSSIHLDPTGLLTGGTTATTVNTASADELFWKTKQSDAGNGNGSGGWVSTFKTKTNPNGAVTSKTGKVTVDFDFQGGVTYTLGLLNAYPNAGTRLVYSTSSLNSNYGYGSQALSDQQAVFSNKVLPVETDGTQLPNFNSSKYQSANPYSGPVNIAFDNRGDNNDRDFQDFAVSAQVVPVPEPSMLGGLAVLGSMLSLTFLRRKVSSKN